MKVTPVSITETTPDETAASIADPEVRGVGVPLTTTVEARFRVPNPPENITPETVSEEQDELPIAALGWLSRQTIRKTCQRALYPTSPGTVSRVWSWRHGTVFVPGTIPRWVQSLD